MSDPLAVLRRLGIESKDRPERLSGGDMGEVFRVGPHVVKTHGHPPAGLFPAEARGLARLADVGVRVPQVRAVDETGIVLEWLAPGPPDWPAMGRLVAALHSVSGADYGSAERLFLGRFELPVGRRSDWSVLYRELRIEPLLAATSSTLGSVTATVRRALEAYSPPSEGPVLVHGDLWAGNVHHAASGPALIDPSVQYAERALDLAMMRLFGGFPASFWRSYEEVRPIPDVVRASIPYHQLLYLLVHVHFFGGSYVRQTQAAAHATIAVA